MRCFLLNFVCFYFIQTFYIQYSARIAFNWIQLECVHCQCWYESCAGCVLCIRLRIGRSLMEIPSHSFRLKPLSWKTGNIEFECFVRFVLCSMKFLERLFSIAGAAEQGTVSLLAFAPTEFRFYVNTVFGTSGCQLPVAIYAVYSTLVVDCTRTRIKRILSFWIRDSEYFGVFFFLVHTHFNIHRFIYFHIFFRLFDWFDWLCDKLSCDVISVFFSRCIFSAFCPFFLYSGVRIIVCCILDQHFLYNNTRWTFKSLAIGIQ